MSAVDRIAAVMMGGADPCEGSLSDAEAILAALPGLLREDSDDGADLRRALGLDLEAIPTKRRVVSTWEFVQRSTSQPQSDEQGRSGIRRPSVRERPANRVTGGPQ